MNVSLQREKEGQSALPLITLCEPTDKIKLNKSLSKPDTTFKIKHNADLGIIFS